MGAEKAGVDVVASTIVAIGSKNPCKIQAVEEVIRDGHMKRMNISGFHSFASLSGISEQPLSQAEIVRGAKNRAEAAHGAALLQEKGSPSDSTSILAIGIESGLCRMDDLDDLTSNANKGGWFDICVVSAYDGCQHRLGLSCGFEIPVPVMAFVLGKERLDLSQATQRAGLTSKTNLGQEEGLIGILTEGRITRLAYTKQAVECSLVAYKNHDWF